MINAGTLLLALAAGATLAAPAGAERAHPLSGRWSATAQVNGAAIPFRLDQVDNLSARPTTVFVGGDGV